MKKNVSLKIKSSQYSENLAPSGEAFKREFELEDTVEIMTEGNLYTKGDSTYIVYEESTEAGLENMKTMLKLNGDTLNIHRYAQNDGEDSELCLREGLLNITRYKIPNLAALDLEVYTSKLYDDLDEEGYGKIQVDYKIKFDQYFSRRNVLEIEVQPS